MSFFYNLKEWLINKEYWSISLPNSQRTLFLHITVIVRNDDLIEMEVQFSGDNWKFVAGNFVILKFNSSRTIEFGC